MEVFFGYSLEKKSGSEFNFAPENTPNMSKLHIGNSQGGHKELFVHPNQYIRKGHSVLPFA